jgi:hypothetical protein
LPFAKADTLSAPEPSAKLFSSGWNELRIYKNQ